MKHISLTFIFILFSQLISNCQPSTNYHLTQKEAEERASLLSNIKYNLNIRLSKDESFEGNVIITFDTWKSANLRLDYFDGEIQSVEMNDSHILETIQHKNGVVILPASSVRAGKNILKVNFRTQYSRSGNGLHKFTDPDDKEIYIYSQFEAFHANKMFPCFDQPDLKATYQLTAEAPKNWKIISSTIANNIIISPSNPDDQIHSFPESEKFSTYVFALHAGPYESFEDKYNSIPLKLYVRKSLAKYVNAKEWFQFTKEGFTFFEKYFDYPYPFSKYDQIIVPEFNFGAMENVGAVTFSERFVSRSPMTRAQRENLSDVILHEMAHMWFGNLVTMKWWNGLWLNESFATYMASLAQANQSEFIETWESFFEKMKQWAYAEDSFSTNHPIEAKVNNTEEAFSQFDGITYGKGASVLKQLAFFIGDSVFQKGVQNYLKRYAFSNSTLKDFLTELELAGGVSLRKWSRDWLETKGTNEIEFISECTDGFLKWKVIQSKPGLENVLRDHKINIGLYKFINNLDSTLKTNSNIEFESFPIIYTGRSTSYVQKVKTCPDFILVNSEDYDFITWKWNEVDLAKIQYILTNDTDSFRKLMLWTSIAEQIELGKASFDDFMHLAKIILPIEDNIKIKRWILSELTSDHGTSYFVSRFWLDERIRNVQLETLSDFLWAGLLLEKGNTDAQKYWFNAFLDSTYLKKEQEQLWNLYSGKILINGLKLDQDQRWSILQKLSSLDFQNAEFQNAIEKEKKADPSSRGVNSAYVIEAIAPNLEIKQKWFQTLLSPKTSNLSNSSLRTVAYNLFPIYQQQIQLQFVKPYLDALGNFDSFDDENYLDAFAKSLAPQFCSNESKTLLTKFLNSNKHLPITIRKTLQKQIDRESICIFVKNETIKKSKK